MVIEFYYIYMKLSNFTKQLLEKDNLEEDEKEKQLQDVKDLDLNIGNTQEQNNIDELEEKDNHEQEEKIMESDILNKRSKVKQLIAKIESGVVDYNTEEQAKDEEARRKKAKEIFENMKKEATKELKERKEKAKQEKAEQLSKEKIEKVEQKEKEKLEQEKLKLEVNAKKKAEKAKNKMHFRDYINKLKRTKDNNQEKDVVEIGKIEGIEVPKVKDTKHDLTLKLKNESKDKKEKVEASKEEKKAEITDKFIEKIMEKSGKEYKFPEGFLWGTSTSSYQVEGGITVDWVSGGKINKIDIQNDWSEWEISAPRKAYLRKKKKNLYDFICSGACDSYNRYKEDFDLAKGLNNNAIRFGIEWARVEYKENNWNVNAIKHYRQMLKEAEKRGLKVFLTVNHWTIPNWLAKKGGWENKEAVECFNRFVNVLIKEFGSLVHYWVVFNEPMVPIFNGYIIKKFPPQKFSPYLSEKCFYNIVRAYKNSYKLIHEHFPNAQVGYTAIINNIEPAHKWNLIELGISKMMHYYWNHRFLKKTEGYFDYIGLDYYFHDRIVWYPPFRKNQNLKINDMGWEIFPEGIYQVLRYLQEFKKPIYILENGLADEKDEYRADFIRDHLMFVHQAIEDGVDVRGYFHWSLLDNFEWAAGYGPKFGLYSVNRSTYVRTERPSAGVYRDICKNNRIIV